MKYLSGRSPFAIFFIFLIICSSSKFLFAASESNRYQGTTNKKKPYNPSRTTNKYIPQTNTNYKPYTPPTKRASYDAGITYSTPSTTSTTQPTYTPPQKTSSTYDTPPGPGIVGFTACVTGCLSLMPFAIVIIIFLLVRSVNKKRLQQIPLTNNLPQNSIQPFPKPRITDFNQGILFHIKENCSNFNEVSFMDRVNSIFYEVQNAKLKRDLKTIRRYVTEGFYNKMKFTINHLITEHKVLTIKDIFIKKISITKYSHDDEMDLITVKIDGSMIEAIIDENNPSKIYSGSLSIPKTISELWTFVKKDKLFDDSEPILPEKCPICGAPVRMSEEDKCEFCGAKLMLNKERNDWLLSDTKPIQELPQT